MFFCDQTAESLESGLSFWPSQPVVRMGWIPARADTETDVASFILTAGMIPLDQASPAVGMAGTRLG